MGVLTVFEIFQITKTGDGFNEGPNLEFAPTFLSSTTGQGALSQTVQTKLTPVNWVPVTDNIAKDIPPTFVGPPAPRTAGSCKDTFDCPSGYACIGNDCILVSGASSSAVGDCSSGGFGGGGGGSGGGDCGSGDCSSLGGGGCSSPSCGGGGGGNPQDCCGARCCRFGTTSQPQGCFCCECPTNTVCSPFCTSYKQGTGFDGPGCTEALTCSECEDCVDGICNEKPPGSAPCQCEGSECSDCESCAKENGVCYRDFNKCVDNISCEYYCKETDKTYSGSIQFPYGAFGNNKRRAKKACIQQLKKEHELGDCECPPPNQCDTFTLQDICSAFTPPLKQYQKVVGYATTCVDVFGDGEQAWIIEDCSEGQQNDPDQCCARCSCSNHKDCGPCGYCNGNCECETYEGCPEGSGGTGTGGPDANPDPSNGPADPTA